MILLLNPGDAVRSKRYLNRIQIGNWKYAAENNFHGGSFGEGTRFIVRDKSKNSQEIWVKIEIPGSDPSTLLKISGEEFGLNFEKL